MNSNKPSLDQAMDRLSREVRDGLRHGFFELTVACEIVKGGKRGLTIKVNAVCPETTFVAAVTTLATRGHTDK